MALRKTRNSVKAAVGLVAGVIGVQVSGSDALAQQPLAPVVHSSNYNLQAGGSPPNSYNQVELASHDKVFDTPPENICIPPKNDAGNCCIPWWSHRSGVFGEWLYLTPGSSDIIYAREETDSNLDGSPTGPLGILNVDASSGFRTGFNIALDGCSSLFGTYTRWDGSTTHTIQANNANILNPVLLHPSTLTAGSTALESTAKQTIGFQFADMGYRRIYRRGDSHVINWTGGLRYGNLEQQLNVDQTVSVPTGLTNLKTDIDFDGLGILGGLDAERQSQNTGLLIYGKTNASMLAGTWKANTLQSNQFGGGRIGNDYRDFRLSPVLEAELGLGWQSQSGKVRLTTGYMTNIWLNAISTRDYLQSFNSSNMVDMTDSISFSGLTSRLELRY